MTNPIPPPDSVDARVISVIEVRFRRGRGVTGDPVRIVIAYFEPDGTFLAEDDPFDPAQP